MIDEAERGDEDKEEEEKEEEEEEDATPGGRACKT